MNDKPRRIGSPECVYPQVVSILRQLNASRVLDCPAGQGPLVDLLAKGGFDVTACDICPDQFRVPDVKCDWGDLNDHLDYADGQFDAVTCLNGLQRVWARGRAVRELARVVRPGGHLIISIPNHGDLRRRLLYLITASQSWTIVGPPMVCPPEAEVPAAHYRYGITLANVLSAVESVGMRVDDIRATHYAKSNLFMSPLLVPIWLANVLAPRRWREFYYLREASSLASFLGAYLIVIATKADPTGAKT